MSHPVYKDTQAVQSQNKEEWLSDYNATPIASKAKNHYQSTDIEEANDEGFGIAGDIPPLIPEGEYTAIYLYHETECGIYGGGKAKLTVEIQDDGIAKYARVSRWYNADITGKPSKGGAFKVKALSDYRREYSNVFKDAESKRRDRLSPRLLIGIALKIEVVTVTRDRNGNLFPKQMHYSKVKRIIGKA